MVVKIIIFAHRPPTIVGVPLDTTPGSRSIFVLQVRFKYFPNLLIVLRWLVLKSCIKVWNWKSRCPTTFPCHQGVTQWPFVARDPLVSRLRFSDRLPIADVTARNYVWISSNEEKFNFPSMSWRIVTSEYREWRQIGRGAADDMHKISARLFVSDKRLHEENNINTRGPALPRTPWLGQKGAKRNALTQEY